MLTNPKAGQTVIVIESGQTGIIRSVHSCGCCISVWNMGIFSPRELSLIAMTDDQVREEHAMKFL